MSTTPNKLSLSENHRRVVSVLLREVEKMCDAVLDWLDKKPGMLHGIGDDVPAEQREQLRGLVGEVQSEVRRFDSEVALDHRVQSRRRAIGALVSRTRIDLEEVKDSKLRGYGQLPEDMERQLGEKLDRLIRLLEAVSEVLEQD